MATHDGPSQALTKRNAETALMPPPPVPKRIKRPPKVLDEDTYTTALDHIIARDFFPGLLETEAQREYIDALDSHNDEWIAEAGRKLTQVMTPGPDGRRMFTPRRGTGFATPLRARVMGDTPREWAGETPCSVKGKEVDWGKSKDDADLEKMKKMGLGSFQAKYTSEDNESFNKLLDKQNQKRADAYAWLWHGNKIPSGGQIAYREREQKLLEASKEPRRIRNNDRALVKRDPEKEADDDARRAMPEHRASAPRNALMFAPDSIEDTHPTRAQDAEARSNMPPKQVVYNNTRLQPPCELHPTADSVPASPSLSAVNDAIAGRPRPSASEAAYTGSETPRVNGYAFVDADDPDPEPDPVPEADKSLLQKLGITAGDAGPNPFTIKQASKREELHHRLVDKSLKSKKEASGGGSSSGTGAAHNRLAALRGEQLTAATSNKTPTPKFASSPIVAGRPRAGGGGAGALTPAAQRLFDRVGNTPKLKESAWSTAFGGSSSSTPRGRTPGEKAARERVRWTPTPKVRRGGGGGA
ncbi:nuclear protein DGCR14 [Phyllosticta citriasiana]|uniref:Nuclear protein DGCR14 n=1 Tax=Phyllosticta citriasiana TaxID=595635 RepID=A0ABR1L2B2_9PEZI